jgi:branched-chain amino acid transport system permease protein
VDGLFESYGFLFVSMLLGALLGLSVYLPLMAGQLSLASPGFYALGGYLAAILSTQVWPVEGVLGIPTLLLEMGLAGLLCGGLAWLLGIPVLRLRGIYLAIATIALVEILRVLALNLEITGGAVGIFGIPQPFPSQAAYLWVTLPLLLLTMLLIYRLERSRVGRALQAIRSDELAASAMGIDTAYYKNLAFTLSGLLAGVVGALSAHFLNTWNARQGTFDASIIFVAFVISGGSRTFLGPVVGGLLLTALPEWLRGLAGTEGLNPALAQFLRDGRLILFGTVIVAASLFFPQGVITPESLNAWRRRLPLLARKR